MRMILFCACRAGRQESGKGSIPAPARRGAVCRRTRLVRSLYDMLGYCGKILRSERQDVFVLWYNPCFSTGRQAA